MNVTITVSWAADYVLNLERFAAGSSIHARQSVATGNNHP